MIEARDDRSCQDDIQEVAWGYIGLILAENADSAKNVFQP
jgi:hypothetical protein